MATPIPDNSACFSLAEVAEACGGTLADGAHASLQVCGVHTDSRRVPRGGLFVALAGERFDGHRFLEQVATAGAGAALVCAGTSAPSGLPVVHVPDTQVALGDLAAFHRRRWGQRLVAITGSAGKTTTKELTWAALDAIERKEAVERKEAIERREAVEQRDEVGVSRVMRTAGNLNNLIGVPMTLFTLSEAHRVAVVELGTSRCGEIARLAEIAAPDVGVVTSVAVAHAEGLGSLSGVASEKADLLRALCQNGTGIYNLDCPALVSELDTVECSKVSFGRADQSAFQLIEQKFSASPISSPALAGAELEPVCCRYRIEGRADELAVPLSMIGDGPAVDTAAALAVVVALYGVEALECSVAGMRTVQPVPGRMSPQEGPGGCLILDDSYNANPASVGTSLRSLSAIGKQRGGRVFAALGDMGELGELSEQAHREVGSLCAELKLAGFVGVGTAMQIAVRVAAGAGLPSAQCVGDAVEVAPLLAKQLRPNDVVLIKGSRSMTMERVVSALQTGGAKA